MSDTAIIRPKEVWTLRIWNGKTVVGVLSVSANGTATFIGAASPLDSAVTVTTEIDPWRGLIHEPGMPRPTYYAENCEPPF